MDQFHFVRLEDYAVKTSTVLENIFQFLQMGKYMNTKLVSTETSNLIMWTYKMVCKNWVEMRIVCE